MSCHTYVMSYHVMPSMSPVIMCLQPMLCHYVTCLCHDCTHPVMTMSCYVSVSGYVIWHSCVSSCHDCLSGYGSRCHVMSHLSPLCHDTGCHVSQFVMRHVFFCFPRSSTPGLDNWNSPNQWVSRAATRANTPENHCLGQCLFRWVNIGILICSLNQFSNRPMEGKLSDLTQRLLTGILWWVGVIK